jgi:dihydrodipicolinate reductase
VQALNRKTSLALPGSLNTRPPLPTELSVAATRAGGITGDHSVVYTSAVDELRIEHRAHTREGFASGAVWAAEFLFQHPDAGFLAFEELFAKLAQSDYPA